MGGALRVKCQKQITQTGEASANKIVPDQPAPRGAVQEEQSRRRSLIMYFLFAFSVTKLFIAIKVGLVQKINLNNPL